MTRSLLELLRDMREREDRSKIRDAVARDDWVAELDRLMQELRRWLRPAVSEGLARVELVNVRVDDDHHFGPYEAPSLKIELPGRRIVSVRPAGALSVGAKGWVDLVCGRNRAMLVLNKRGMWKLRGCDAARKDGKLEPLDEPHFTRVIAELVEA